MSVSAIRGIHFPQIDLHTLDTAALEDLATYFANAARVTAAALQRRHLSAAYTVGLRSCAANTYRPSANDYVRIAEGRHRGLRARVIRVCECGCTEPGGPQLWQVFSALDDLLVTCLPAAWMSPAPGITRPAKYANPFGVPATEPAT